MKTKKHVPKLLLILLMLSFLGFTSFFIVPVHATITIPSGIVYYVPVTLTNSQNSAVSSESQVSITVNWANYASYLDNPVDNYVFFNSAGNTLCSWLESGTTSTATSALLWLKIDSSITASGGTYTVYLGFYAKGDNVLNSAGATGWAPQLSGTYGQYDNGANVFLVYFNGNSDLSNFQVDRGSDDSVTSVLATFGSSTINAIMYAVGDNENSNDGLMYTGQNISANQNAIAESSFSSDGSGTDLGAIGLGSNDGQGVANNFISTSTQYSGAYFDQAFDDDTLQQNFVDFNQQGSTTTAWRYASITYISTDFFYGYIAPQLYSISGGYRGTVNYADQGQSNPFAGVSTLYLFFYPDVGGSGAWIQYNWARARLYPPNGVMPSCAVYAALSVGSASASASPIDRGVGTSDLSVSVSGGSGSCTYQWSMEAPGASSFTDISGATSATYHFAPLSSATVGDYKFEVEVSDSVTSETGASGSATVQVNSALATPVVTPAPTTVDQCQTSSLTSTDITATGTGPYTYQWLQEAPGAISYSNVGTNSPSFVTDSLTVTGLWSFELQVTDGAEAIVASNVVTVMVNAAPTVSVSPSSWTMDAGQSKTFSATPSGGSVSYTSYQWYVDGVLALSGTASVMSFTPGSSGSYLITVTVTDSLGVTSALSSAAVVTVNHASAVSITLSPAGSATITAGDSKTYSATGSDAYGNTWDVTSSTTWSISSGAGGSWLGNVYTSATAGSWTVTGTYNSAPYTTGLTVNPAAATYLVVSSGTSQVAGTAFSVTVTAEDVYGNTATGYTGTVHFSSSDSGSGSSMPSDYTFLSGDLGTHTFTDGVTLVTAGTESVTATDTVTESTAGSQSGITVDHASAVSIAVTPATATITAGNTETYRATASDAYGNSWDVTSSTTWSISSGAGGSWLGNVYTSATAGSWAVTGTYDSVPYTTGLTVTPAGLNSITISPVSPSIVAGGSQTFSAEGFDQYGNDLGSVTASYSVNGASITGSLVSETFVGSYMVTASYSGYMVDATLTVNAGALDHLVFNSVGSQTAGSAFSITVTAVDVFGNTITGSTGTPSLSYSAGSISPSTMGAFVNGVGTTTVTVTAAGSGVTITATAGSHTGTSNSFTVNPTITASAGAKGTISPSGSVSVNYGSNQSFTITPSTGYSIASLTVDGSPVTVASSYTFRNVQAAHTISATFAVNTFTISASAGANGAINPTGSVSVNYGGSQSFSITASTGYHIADVVVNSVSQGAVSSYTFTNVQAAQMITASFAINTTTTTTIIGIESNTTIVPITLEGNITAQQMLTNVTITPYQITRTTTVSFTITGPSGTVGFGNMTLPKYAILYGTTPVVYIDGQQAPNQGYTQDANNFYVWYTTHFSTHQVTIRFTVPPATSLGLALAVVITVAAIILIFIAIAIKRLRRKPARAKLSYIL